MLPGPHNQLRHQVLSAALNPWRPLPRAARNCSHAEAVTGLPVAQERRETVSEPDGGSSCRDLASGPSPKRTKCPRVVLREDETSLGQRYALKIYPIAFSSALVMLPR
jgi:hypothetical protein